MQANQPNHRQIWDLYSQSWKSTNLSERVQLFKKSLDQNCRYTDPLISTSGWDELMAYIEQFQKQIPGGYFETTYFLTHHSCSVAKWVMKNSDRIKIGEGYSFAEYTAEGKLIKMTGFYELPA